MGKRLFDLFGSIMGLSLLALPMLLVALWIRLDSPGPALFRQERVGRHGRIFRIHKFRTMHMAAASPAEPLLTMKGDRRITRAGRWLRDRRLDEMPQLLDVLQGHMSLVGPRPEVPRFVDRYPEALRRQVLAVRPGLTDPAALAHRDEGRWLAQAADPERHYLEHILPGKLRMQIDYLTTATWVTDLGVLLRTLRVLLGART